MDTQPFAATESRRSLSAAFSAEDGGALGWPVRRRALRLATGKERPAGKDMGTMGRDDRRGGHPGSTKLWLNSSDHVFGVGIPGGRLTASP